MEGAKMTRRPRVDSPSARRVRRQGAAKACRPRVDGVSENLQNGDFRVNLPYFTSRFPNFASKPSLNLVRQGHSGAEIRVFQFPAFSDSRSCLRRSGGRVERLSKGLVAGPGCPPLGAGAKFLKTPVFRRKRGGLGIFNFAVGENARGGGGRAEGAWKARR